MFPALALAAVLHRPEVLVCAVAAEAEKVGIDPVIVCSLVEVESGYNPWAKSSTGDYGLLQVNERWHGRYVDPAANIRRGVGIYLACLRRSGESDIRALSRYNTGRVSARGLRYARKVLSIAARLRKALGVKVWPYGCSLRLWQSDSWCGLWSVDYAPRKRRGGKVA